MKFIKERKLWILLLFLIIASMVIYNFYGRKKEADTKIEPIQRTEFKLNTFVTITLYDSTDEAILDKAMELCDYYEAIYSRTLETSELYELNHKSDESLTKETTYHISPQLYDIIEKGLHYSDLSGGKFDITIEPVTKLWDFTGTPKIIPEESVIAPKLPLINYKNAVLKDNTITFLQSGMGLDLGGIAKGYIADRIKEYLLEAGVTSAMINLGGNVLCVGSKPEGEAFKVGIQKPFANRNDLAAVMEVRDMSVVSSGIYERFIEEGDLFYHHILNPKTGYSYNNGLVSVTIISETSIEGDGLSTGVFALGLEEGMKLIDSLPDTYGVFITEDYNIHYSAGLLEYFTIKEVD